MKRIWILVAALMSMVFSSAAFAQQQLKVSTGSAGWTYSRMFNEFKEFCGTQIPLIEMPSTGSVQNMDRIIGNDANGAIVQTDVLFYRARNEDLSNIKTLFALHSEEVHLATPVVSPIKAGGVMGVGAKPVQFQDVTSLAGQVVAAWGGGYITAQVIRLQTEIPFQVAEVANFEEAQKLVQSGQAAALLAVGGQPVGEIAKLDRGWKLLSFPEQVAVKLKSVYVPAKLNYSNLGQNGQGVQTVATEALFITRAYKTPKYTESLGALRACFYRHADDLAEKTGTHKKWANVSTENHGKWAYYDLPGSSTTKKMK